MMGLCNMIAGRRAGFHPRRLFGPASTGFLYDMSMPARQIFFQDFAMTPADDLGESIRLILDALSLGREKVGFLDGSSGLKFSIPDAAFTAITTLRLWGEIAAFSLTPSGEQLIEGHWDGGSGQRAYGLFLSTSGALIFRISTDGTLQAGNTVTSTASLTTVTTSGSRILVDATWTIATKAVVFRYSLNGGQTWTALGTAGATADATVHNSTAPIVVGSSATTSGLAGKVYDAGIDFDGAAFFQLSPENYSGSGSTYTCTTGQTVTRNGTAFIAGDGYHAVAPSGMMQLGRMPYGGRRNLLNATATLATQNVTVAATAYTLQFTGAGTITLSGAHSAGPLSAGTHTFTPSAGTLTLTVSGSVTNAQLELGSTATAYQLVAAQYDITQTGIPSVTWLYAAGTQYYSILGSRILVCMHDGTGGFAGMNVYVNKVDDGADDYFYASRTGSTVIGSALVLVDSSTANGQLGGRISNGTSDIISVNSSDAAVTRFEPLTVSNSFNSSDSPDYTARINGASVASGNAGGTPSTAAAANDIALFGSPSGTLILPGYLGSVIMGNITNAAQQAQVVSWLGQQSG